ncbi:MAG: gliding motility-associated C-terminal domain-containing protein [Flavobacteriales bacterium]|nr:gliding motility-associated C-terminal domain-containing protein [Flavobacteriales bacterium]
MKKNVCLLLLICLSFTLKSQCVRDTFHISRISCYDSLGLIVPIYSLPTINNQGNSFTIDTLYANVGDTINFQLTATHNAVEVSQTTWLANVTISNGGFNLPLGVDSFIVLNNIGTYYYVCQPHVASDTMKAVIIVTGNPFTYQWFNASNVLVSTNDSLISNVCGPFSVKVYDHNGAFCDSASRFLGCPLSIGGGQTNINCYGDSTGELIRTGTSGMPPYSYEWYKDNVLFSTGLDDTLQSNLSAGISYKVIVIDSIGCKDSIITNFNNPQQIEFHEITFDSINCNGDSTIVKILVKGGSKYTNGVGYSYYLIQNNDTIAFKDTIGQSNSFTSIGFSPTSATPDTITFSSIFASLDSLLISVVDSFGCTNDTTIFIPQPDSIIASIYTNTYPICSYDSTWIYLDSISGGVGPYTYWWTNGTNLDSIYVAAGFNRLFVTDANGCLDSTNGIDVITPEEITVNDSIIDVICNGDTTGQIHLQISGGTGTITQDWGLGVNPMALSAGTYPVLINDSQGCLYPATSYTVTENPIINLSFSNKNPTCLNHANGSIKVDITGGIAPYSILWDNTNTTDSIFGLAVGMYLLEVTDSLGCIMRDSVELQSTDSLIISFTNYTANLSCYGGITAITANISGGVTANGNYTILWDNGDTINQTILGGGTHKILVSDDVGCEDSASVFIASPNPLVVLINKTNPSCLGNDGSIDVVVTGGTLPYQYQWSTGAIGTSINSLIAGNYWIIVTDSCGIKDSLGIVLDPFISTLNIDNYNLIQPSCLDNDGMIDITVSGGFTPYTYLWSNGDTTQDISGLGFGTYTVLITDDCGLETTGIYTLNQMPNTVSANEFYDYLSLWSSISVSGSNPPFTINWTMLDSSIMTGDSIQGLCQGDYFYEVTDSANCTYSDTFYVLYINQLVNPNTSTVIDTSWGIGPFSYLWSDGQTTPHADSLCEGTHTVTVSALGGPFVCDLSESFPISALEVILYPSLTIVDCEDDFDGTIIVNPDGGTPNLGTPPYRFLWSTGDTIDRIEENLNPGTYYVSVFDRNGCQLDTSIIIAAMGADCIPNVFSPNGDNVNDVWELEESFLYSETIIKIYGRFGKKMFESNGYDTPWDGTNKKGRAVPDGTYFYIINLGRGNDPIKGTITIIR